MTSTTREVNAVERARDAARRAAARAGVDIVELDDVDRIKQATRLFARIWSTGEERPPVSADVLRALSHNGNYVAAATIGGEMVGASMGFLALDGAGLKLHSHITGIAPHAQGRSVGAALKQHQRWWSMSRGIETITWTFDPLVRRNAWFNVVKLGASIIGYHPNFYGAMEDGVNVGDESDRCVAEWALDSERAVLAAEGTTIADDAAALLEAGAALALREGPDGRPLLAGGRGAVRLCSVPDGIVELRRRDPDGALAWRRALRTVFLDALDEGLVATSMTRDGCYVLGRP